MSKTRFHGRMVKSGQVLLNEYNLTRYQMKKVQNERNCTLGEAIEYTVPIETVMAIQQVAVSKEIFEKTLATLSPEMRTVALKAFASSISGLYVKKQKEKRTYPNMWTKKEINFLKKNYSLLSVKEISEKLGRSKSAVQKRANTLNLKKRIPWSEEDTQFILDNYKTHSFLKISKELDKSYYLVLKKAKELGLK